MKMKGLFKTIWVAAVAFVIMTATSCSSDTDYFGLDELEGSAIIPLTETDSEYLDLDIDTITVWSNNDLRILNEAEYRMGITYDNEKREYSKKHESYLELNISKKLYNRIWDNYCYNNSILSVSSLARVKSRNIETTDSQYNCVPLSLSHCCNKPYDEVVKVCSKHDSIWPNRGVDLCYVALIVADLGKCVTTYYGRSDIIDSYGDSVVPINGMLITETGGTPQYHAVCAYKYDGSGLIFNKIFYNDYQTNKNGWVAASQAHVLFIIK